MSIEKERGEILGLAIVESGWGSILPTAIIANMMHGGPAEKSGKLNTGDQIMSVNGTSLVGLPLSSCQNIIKVSPPHLSEGLMTCLWVIPSPSWFPAPVVMMRQQEAHLSSAPPSL